MADLFADDGVYEDFAFQIKSSTPAGAAQWVDITASSIPDAHVEVIEAFRSRRRIAVKWIFSGTPLSIAGVPSTGKSFAVPAVSYFEVRRGRIQRVGDFYNLADLLRQLDLPCDTWTPLPPAPADSVGQPTTEVRAADRPAAEPDSPTREGGSPTISGRGERGTGLAGGPRLRVAPNPLSEESTLSFAVPESGFASLVVYDDRGAPVADLFGAHAESGETYTVPFGANQLRSGLYAARLTGANYTEVIRLVVAK